MASELPTDTFYHGDDQLDITSLSCTNMTRGPLAISKGRLRWTQQLPSRKKRAPMTMKSLQNLIVVHNFTAFVLKVETVRAPVFPAKQAIVTALEFTKMQLLGSLSQIFAQPVRRRMIHLCSKTSAASCSKPITASQLFWSQCHTASSAQSKYCRKWGIIWPDHQRPVRGQTPGCQQDNLHHPVTNKE